MAEAVQISVARDPDRLWCAQQMANTDPWLTYGFSVETCSRILQWPGSTLFVATIHERVGFLLLHPKGFLGCPYIAVVAVSADRRSRGIGAQLLKFAEAQFSGSRHVYLCVSSFNPRALQLYEKCGYVQVGELPDFIADGYSELLMQKRLS